MLKKKESMPEGVRKAVSAEAFIFSGIFFGAFILLGSKMGAANMFNTMMNTAHDLLINTVFYIMSIAVLAGAVSALWSEFGLISLLNKLLSPLMKPVFGLPGASAVGVFTTYLSDNPAILTLAEDNNFRRYFKKYQLPALCNIGTSFGMGLIITTYMVGLKSPIGENFAIAALIGNVGAIIGSVVSTRIMLWQTAKIYGKEADCDMQEDAADALDTNVYRRVRRGDVGSRFISALLDGGKSGVDMGLSIIPGVLIICTLVMMLTNSMPAGGYTGAAYEGIGLLPWIGGKFQFVLMPLFGFSSAESIAVPITALGAAGAAIGIVEKLLSVGLANAHDIAVFTAMCMCWSGYLSTHVAMMDSLKSSELTGKAIVSHTIGGLCAGVAANWIFKLVMLIL
jgi:nucleoside recognition membrane protein YjiH